MLDVGSRRSMNPAQAEKEQTLVGRSIAAVAVPAAGGGCGGEQGRREGDTRDDYLAGRSGAAKCWREVVLVAAVAGNCRSRRLVKERADTGSRRELGVAQAASGFLQDCQGNRDGCLSH